MTTFDPSIGKSTRWKKGQPSPNPGGRPKSRLLSDAIRVRLGEVKPDDPEHGTTKIFSWANIIRILQLSVPRVEHLVPVREHPFLSRAGETQADRSVSGKISRTLVEILCASNPNLLVPPQE
jgi:hypothetical protein